MAVLFTNTQGATKVSAPPRVLTVYDAVAGCPNTTRTSPVLTVTATLTGPAYIRGFASMVRTFNGRTDGQIYVQGPAGSSYATNTMMTRRLNQTQASAIENVVFDIGFYADIAGTWTVALYVDSPGSWGCGAALGKLSILILAV